MAREKKVAGEPVHTDDVGEVVQSPSGRKREKRIAKVKTKEKEQLKQVMDQQNQDSSADSDASAIIDASESDHERRMEADRPSKQRTPSPTKLDPKKGK